MEVFFPTDGLFNSKKITNTIDRGDLISSNNKDMKQE